MLHNIKKIKEVLVPFTDEDNEGLSDDETAAPETMIVGPTGGIPVPPPLPPRRPSSRTPSADTPRQTMAEQRSGEAPPPRLKRDDAAYAAAAAADALRGDVDRRDPRTEAEGRAAMKAYKEAWEQANADHKDRPITSENPAGEHEYPTLLTLASVSWYVHGWKVLPEIPLYKLETTPIEGGNLNYAWRCGPSDDPSISVFVKQAPAYIRCLGPEYPLTNLRAQVEANALKALRAICPNNAPEVLVYDDYRCAMILEDLRDFRLLRDDLLRGMVDETVAEGLGRFCAEVYDATHDKDDAYFTNIFGDDDNGAMRAITRDYVFTKPFRADATNRTLDEESGLGFRVANARADAGLLAAVKRANAAFDDAHDCLSHGDLHAGSVMVGNERTVAIDAEFACRGPAGLDVAFLIAGYLFAFCAADARALDAEAAGIRRVSCGDAIRALWRAYGETRHAGALAFADVSGFLGCELLRRVLGAASVPDLAEISDPIQKERAELLAVEVGVGVLVDAPETVELLVAFAEGCYDSLALDKY